jgi:hypothetical protein
MSKCQVFTSRAGGTTVAAQHTLLQKEQWVGVGEIHLYNDERDEINIGAIATQQLILKVKEWIKEKEMLDDD